MTNKNYNGSCTVECSSHGQYVCFFIDQSIHIVQVHDSCPLNYISSRVMWDYALLITPLPIYYLFHLIALSSIN